MKFLLSFVIITCVVSTQKVCCQNKTIDSLKALLPTQKEDTNKVNILNEISKALTQNHNYTNAIAYANEALSLSAEINFNEVPKFDFLKEYIQQKSMPGGTQRNWESYGSKISVITDEQKAILADPQTSGGLLVSVDQEKKNEFESFAKTLGLELKSFGKMIPKGPNLISVV